MTESMVKFRLSFTFLGKSTVVILLYLLLGGTIHWVLSNSGAPPFSRTGSPGDGNNCTICHSGTPVSNSGSLSLSGLPTLYVPGQNYSLTLTLSDGPRYGFEITAEKTSDNTKAGSWTAGASNSVISTNWVGHTSANTTTNSWPFTWTAPSAGAGNVRLYAAGMAANDMGNTSGDTVHLKNWLTGEAIPPSLTSLSVNFGSVGQPVTLTGTDFGTITSTVSFNGTYGAVTSWADTSIDVTVPSGASTGNVTVENSSGTSSGIAFTVIIGAPTVASITPSSGTTNPSVTITNVTGTNFSPSATLKLTKTGETDITATGVSIPNSTTVDSASFNLSGAATGTWNVIITNPDSQSGSLTDGFLIQVPPAQPTGFVGNVLSTTSIQWNWNDIASNEDGYRILSDTAGVFSPDLNPDTTFYVETGLTANQQAIRLVQAFNDFGTADSGQQTLYSLANPPINLIVTGRSSSSIGLDWDGNGNATNTPFEVSMSTDNFSLNISTPIPLSSNLTISATTVFSLTLGTTYSFRIRAFNGDSIVTIFSNVITTDTVNIPDPPSSFSGLTLTTSSIQWSWQDNSNDEVGFRVSSSTGGQVSPDLSTNTITWIQTGLAVNVGYQNFVAAFNSLGNSPPSNTDTKFTLADPPTNTGVVAVDFSNTSLHITWSTSSATGYGLERSLSASSGFGEIVSSTTLTASTSFYQNTGLESSTSYFYRLRGFNGDGVATAYDAIAVGRTNDAPPQAPALSGVALSKTSILWSWTIPDGTQDFALKTSNGVSVVSLAATVSSTIETGLTPATLYTRFIRSSNATGSSDSSLSTVATAQSGSSVYKNPATTL